MGALTRWAKNCKPDWNINVDDGIFPNNKDNAETFVTYNDNTFLSPDNF